MSCVQCNFDWSKRLFKPGIKIDTQMFICCTNNITSWLHPWSIFNAKSWTITNKSISNNRSIYKYVCRSHSYSDWLFGEGDVISSKSGIQSFNEVDRDAHSFIEYNNLILFVYLKRLIEEESEEKRILVKKQNVKWDLRDVAHVQSLYIGVLTFKWDPRRPIIDGQWFPHTRRLIQVIILIGQENPEIPSLCILLQHCT